MVYFLFLYSQWLWRHRRKLHRLVSTGHHCIFLLLKCKTFGVVGWPRRPLKIIFSVLDRTVLSSWHYYWIALWKFGHLTHQYSTPLCMNSWKHIAIIYKDYSFDIGSSNIRHLASLAKAIWRVRIHQIFLLL